MRSERNSPQFNVPGLMTEHPDTAIASGEETLRKRRVSVEADIQKEVCRALESIPDADEIPGGMIGSKGDSVKRLGRSRVEPLEDCLRETEPEVMSGFIGGVASMDRRG